MRKAWIIARKEWSEVFRNRFVLFTVVFLPLILTALPLGMLYFMGRVEDFDAFSMEDLPQNFVAFCGEMTSAECGQYYLVSQFMVLFMLIPLAIPVTIASYSITGEKTTRTLEPVLATPIHTSELLFGKVLAALTPAVLATWGCFTLFLLGASFLVVGPGVMDRLLDPLWLIAVFIVGPLLALASVNVAVMVSSRANDPRVAEQLSMLVILPLMLVFFAQIVGIIFIDDQMILWMALAMLCIDAALLYFSIHIFQRETILTRWK